MVLASNERGQKGQSFRDRLPLDQAALTVAQASISARQGPKRNQPFLRLMYKNVCDFIGANYN